MPGAANPVTGKSKLPAFMPHGNGRKLQVPAGAVMELKIKSTKAREAALLLAPHFVLAKRIVCSVRS